MSIQFIISQSSLQMHEKAAQDFITQVGKSVTIFYPPIQVKCINCLNGDTYVQGGPVPFPNYSPCPWCEGKNVINQQETRDTMTCMLYFNPKDWISYGEFNIKISEAHCQMRGLMGDLQKVIRANFAVFHKGDVGMGPQKFVKLGDWVPAGVRLQTEFYQMWKRGA